MFSFFRRKKAEPTPDQAPATAEAPADTPPLDAPALPLDDLERQALAAAPADETPGAAADEPAPPPATNGGSLELESAVGQGAEFRLVLPASASD